ncbi:hypothetical protein J3A83DRAFT_4298073 [Scleroderma citrinum]
MANGEQLNVSLEPHLQDALASIHKLTPTGLSEDLAPYLSAERDTTDDRVIPYAILQKVSRWAQTLEGITALQECSPQLDPRSFTMTSLLVGTRTSPEKRFPPYVPRDPLEERRRAIDDRKAISAVVNAVVSVIGTGAATWWVSDRTGLKLEWVSAMFLSWYYRVQRSCTAQRSLVAVSAAIIVAIAEVILYMIWDSRKGSKSKKVRRRIITRTEKVNNNTDDTGGVPVQATSTALHDSGLRHRFIELTNVTDH